MSSRVHQMKLTHLPGMPPLGDMLVQQHALRRTAADVLIIAADTADVLSLRINWSCQHADILLSRSDMSCTFDIIDGKWLLYTVQIMVLCLNLQFSA